VDHAGWFGEARVFPSCTPVVCFGGILMKSGLAFVLAAAMVSGVFGCSYGGVATVGDKVVIARNDSFLYGALRKVFVCKVADTGVSSCQAADAP